MIGTGHGTNTVRESSSPVGRKWLWARARPLLRTRNGSSEVERIGVLANKVERQQP